MYKRILKIIGLSLLLVVLFIVGWFIYERSFGPYAGIGGGAAHFYYMESGDRDRLRTIQTLKVALIITDDEKDRYPENLEALVLNGEITDLYLKDKAGKSYLYASNTNGTDYVIGIELGVWPKGVEYDRYIEKAGKMSRARILENDIDGILYGVNCDDPIYCTSSTSI